MALLRIALFKMALLRIALFKMALFRMAFDECGAAEAAVAAGADRPTAAMVAAATAAAALTRIRDIFGSQEIGGRDAQFVSPAQRGRDSHYGPFSRSRFGYLPR